MDPGLLAEARQIADRSEIIDLHLDTLISVRLFGWDVNKRHGRGITFGSFFGHVDLPRLKEGRLGGGMWSITTNPFRFAQGRWKVFQKNLVRMKDLIESTAGQMAMVRTLSEYKAARARGAHAAMISVQGGNCFDAAPNSVESVANQEIVRVTVLHLTNSWLGGTSAPNSRLRRKRGLTEKGRHLISSLNRARVFVDLAHIHPDGFWDAVDIHDRTQPLLATHTGVAGVRPHWRNLDDRQLRAIADTGGTVGIIYSKNFLQTKRGPKDGAMVVEHMEHVIKAVGEDFVSIGSDYDGAIIPPRGLDSADSYVRLIGHMLERRWPVQRIEKALGQNFLRAFALLRP